MTTQVWWRKPLLAHSTFQPSCYTFHFSEANNVDIGLNLADDLEQLRNNLNKFKKAGMGGELDIDIEQMDWVEENRKVKAFFIYETSL